MLFNTARFFGFWHPWFSNRFTPCRAASGSICCWPRVTSSTPVGIRSYLLSITGIPTSVTAGTSEFDHRHAAEPRRGHRPGFLGTIQFTSMEPQGRPAGRLHFHRRRRRHLHVQGVELKTAGSQAITATSHREPRHRAAPRRTSSSRPPPRYAEGRRLPESRHGRLPRRHSPSPPTMPTVMWPSTITGVVGFPQQRQQGGPPGQL